MNTATTMREFVFDAGVRVYELRNPSYKPSKGERITANGVMTIPFECEDVPEGATFKFAADNPDLAKNGLLCREIHNSILASKYAFFCPPIQPIGSDARTLQYLHDNPPPAFNPSYRAGFTVALTKFHAEWCDAHPDATREERAAAYQATATSLRRDFPTEAERQHKRQFSTHN